MTDKKIVTAICQECGKQFEYELNPKYPRKYCFECSAAKKASYEAEFQEDVPVVKPGEPAKTQPEAPGKEYHLTQESQRAEALRCAIEVNKTGNPTDLMEIAKKFKEYIENGN